MLILMWLILGCLCLGFAGLWLLLVVQNRDLLTRFVQQDDEIQARLKALKDRLDVYELGLVAKFQSLEDSLKPPPEEPLEYPPGTSFLPGEVGEREIEKMIVQSEDRTIGPVRARPSSPPSEPSRPSSPREPWTRGVRRSGTR